MSIGWMMGGFFVFVTFVFMAVAIFLPEWVGITGKKAKQIIKEQQGDVIDSSSANADSTTAKPQ
jgi:hypothetical protein